MAAGALGTLLSHGAQSSASETTAGPPCVLCLPFSRPAPAQTIGPRHAFAEARQLEGHLRCTDGHWDLRALSCGGDAEFVESLGGSINEYEGFRVAFEVGGRGLGA